jgi:hypothetical protein
VKSVVQSVELPANFQTCFVQSKLRSKNFPDNKKYTQFFFLFRCQEYKYCNEGRVWVRHPPPTLLSSLSQCQSPVFHITRKAHMCLAVLHDDHTNVGRSLHNKSVTITHASQNAFCTILRTYCSSYLFIACKYVLLHI